MAAEDNIPEEFDDDTEARRAAWDAAARTRDDTAAALHTAQEEYEAAHRDALTKVVSPKELGEEFGWEKSTAKLASGRISQTLDARVQTASQALHVARTRYTHAHSAADRAWRAYARSRQAPTPRAPRPAPVTRTPRPSGDT